MAEPSFGWTKNWSGNVPGDGPTPAFYIPLTSDINATIGGGTLTGTAFNSAAVSGGKLDLTGSTNKYVDWSGTNNVNSATQTGAMRYKLTPNYTGSPATQQVFALIQKADTDFFNVIEVYHMTAGGLAVDIFDSGGGAIFTGSLGAWSPTSGTEYEIELNWDINAGTHRLFVGGVQFGSTMGGTGSRSTAVATVRIGSNYNHTATANFSVRNFSIFNTVQHTSNYTP